MDTDDPYAEWLASFRSSSRILCLHVGSSGRVVIRRRVVVAFGRLAIIRSKRSRGTDTTAQRYGWEERGVLYSNSKRQGRHGPQPCLRAAVDAEDEVTLVVEQRYHGRDHLRRRQTGCTQIVDVVSGKKGRGVRNETHLVDNRSGCPSRRPRWVIWGSRAPLVLAFPQNTEKITVYTCHPAIADVRGAAGGTCCHWRGPAVRAHARANHPWDEPALGKGAAHHPNPRAFRRMCLWVRCACRGCRGCAKRRARGSVLCTRFTE